MRNPISLPWSVHSRERGRVRGEGHTLQLVWREASVLHHMEESQLSFSVDPGTVETGSGSTGDRDGRPHVGTIKAVHIPAVLVLVLCACTGAPPSAVTPTAPAAVVVAPTALATITPVPTAAAAPTLSSTAVPTEEPTAVATTAPARVPDGSSPLAAGPVGASVSGIVECGEGYTTHEMYNVHITVLDVERGQPALEQMQAADASAAAPEAGFEYVLARVKFEYSARMKPGTCKFKVWNEQFAAMSSDGQGYASVSVAPELTLAGMVGSGESIEGSVAFSVAEADAAPVMSFSQSPEGAYSQGGNMWFRLYLP